MFIDLVWFRPRDAPRRTRRSRRWWTSARWSPSRWASELRCAWSPSELWPRDWSRDPVIIPGDFPIFDEIWGEHGRTCKEPCGRVNFGDIFLIDFLGGNMRKLWRRIRWTSDDKWKFSRGDRDQMGFLQPSHWRCLDPSLLGRGSSIPSIGDVQSHRVREDGVGWGEVGWDDNVLPQLLCNNSYKATPVEQVLCHNSCITTPELA